MTSGPAYVEGALVEGFAAHVIDRVLARHLPAYLAAFTPEQRAAIDAARVAIKCAADRYEQLPIAADGNAETRLAAVGADSAREQISTSEAAVILGLSERRARQLAAGGMGRKTGGVWLLDRSSVLDYREQRRSA